SSPSLFCRIPLMLQCSCLYPLFPISLSFFFSFSCSSDHRDLHSFPTRRSSDLKLAEFCDVFVEPGAFNANEARRIVAAARSLGLDRKSTRLNSSHGSISYAVFCLKKKKKKERNSIIKKQKKKTHNEHTNTNRRYTSTKQQRNLQTPQV